ncbi:PLD-like domain-containing protein [Filimonas lacunae]|uniref:phospholipase D n=1 Tax=Filimonas lacunae TaxID=477680 RepID=A0A173MHV0_9BACT|nr:phospholipase D-like domain-containing protein [Filimonas lacunae]BAV07175.1 hypothetical protein FLA_3198 [Filimonas lacunae]SIS93780.1 PLD-like domain-containing protein [Filimonas lacunae]
MTKTKTSLTVNILRGDAKVLIACNLDKKDITNLAGFTIQCQPEGMTAYYLFNKLQFPDVNGHARVAKEPAQSSVNAPIQKFRWLHVPGGVHQLNGVIYGKYTYTVTPRYFDKGKLLPIDKQLSVTVKTVVAPFEKNNIQLGFTRGFVQSQAFVNHFGLQALFKPKDNPLLFDTTQQAGINNEGQPYSFLDEYNWSGFTARQKIFGVLEEVLKNKNLQLDVFAYDLNETDILKHFITLAGQGRIRIILDDAPLHHDTKDPKPEDEFEKAFRKADKKQLEGGKKVSSIIRGNFSRFQHNKVMLVSKGKQRTPVKVVSGSTNFSTTGMYVNSNHIIVFNDANITALYQQLFNEAWNTQTKTAEFLKSVLPTQEFVFKGKAQPYTAITFAPHTSEQALTNLNKIVDRMNAETNSILFAVMGTDPKTTGPVAPALIELNKRTNIFSCGITDSDNGLTFYKPSATTGIRVTGKPGKTLLPPPFNQEKSVGIGHQVHHKFIVCGFNTPNAVVWLGSSNLALGGEMANGDNLIEIRDKDIATVFALEALALVDHFQFRNAFPAPEKKTNTLPPTFSLSTDGKWARSYYQKNDLHCVDRELFAVATTKNNL